MKPSEVSLSGTKCGSRFNTKIGGPLTQDVGRDAMTAGQSLAKVLALVKEEMVHYGFSVQKDSRLRGKSGSSHRFAFVATDREGNSFVVEVVSSGPIGSLLEIFTKTLDTKVKAIVVWLDSSATFSNLAREYGILTTDGTDFGKMFSRWYQGELEKPLMVAAGAALEGMWRRTRPVLDSGSKMITAGTLLAVHEVEALRIAGAPRVVVGGKPILT